MRIFPNSPSPRCYISYWSFLTILLLLSSVDIAKCQDYRILILGNSYTGGIGSQLQHMLDSSTQVSGYVRTLAGGGLKLSQHATRWDDSVLDTEEWDFVVLQDQSQVPSFPSYNAEFQASRDGAIVLDDKAEAAGAEVMFFLTWGRRLGDSRNSWLNPDYLTMQSNLERGYQRYAEAITTDDRIPYIAPVGLAFKKIYDDIVAQGGNPTDDDSFFTSLYKSDGSHQSDRGAYLAACVFFSAITGESSIGMGFRGNSNLEESVLLQLQEAADFVVFDSGNDDYGYPWERTNDGGPVEPVTNSPTISPADSKPDTKPPTIYPSRRPSEAPSESPSESPSLQTSISPSLQTSISPSMATSGLPTTQSSGSPSIMASESPTVQASDSPSTIPSDFPSLTPSMSPTTGAPSLLQLDDSEDMPVASVLDTSATTTTTRWCSILLAGFIPLLITLIF